MYTERACTASHHKSHKRSKCSRWSVGFFVAVAGFYARRGAISARIFMKMACASHFLPQSFADAAHGDRRRKGHTPRLPVVGFNFRAQTLVSISHIISWCFLSLPASAAATPRVTFGGGRARGSRKTQGRHTFVGFIHASRLARFCCLLFVLLKTSLGSIHMHTLSAPLVLPPPLQYTDFCLLLEKTHR